LGDYLVSEYGARDEYSLIALQQRAKDRKANDYDNRYAELVELILNWQKMGQ